MENLFCNRTYIIADCASNSMHAVIYIVLGTKLPFDEKMTVHSTQTFLQDRYFGVGRTKIRKKV